MRSEQDYSFSNYIKIQFSHHKLMMIIVSCLYIVMQTITIARITYDQYGYQIDSIVTTFVFAVVIAIIMYRLRDRLDYVPYKYFFVKSHKTRYLYKHNQLIGPMIIYLITYLSGGFGLVLVLILSRPGQDYLNFKADALALNRNYGEINMLITELLYNPNLEDYEEAFGFIKYNISMYNMYEIALFEEQAKTISYEQLVENIKG